MKMETPTGVVKNPSVNSLTKTSLTPCRRIGLSRPSSGSLKKSLHARTLNTPVQNESPLSKEVKMKPVIDSVERLKVPLKSSNLNKVAGQRVKRCLTNESKTPESRLKRVFHSRKSIGDADDLKSVSEVNIDDLGKSNEDKKRKLNTNSIKSDEKETKHTTQIENSFSSITSLAVSPEKCAVVDVSEESEEVTPEMIQQLILSVTEKQKKLDQLKTQEIYAKKHNLEELRNQTAKWRTAGQEALRYSVSLARQAGFSVTLKQLMTQHGFPPELMKYNSDDDEFD